MASEAAVSPKRSQTRDRWLDLVSKWDNTEADARIREGLPMSLAVYLQDVLELTDEEAANLIGRSRSTYNRYRNEGRKLGASEAERVVRYARLLSLAAVTLGSLDEAKDWMREANYALGGLAPLDMAETDPGSRIVQDLLLGLQYGHPV